MRYDSKKDLINRIEKEHQILVDLVRSIPRSQYREPGVWGDDWTIGDLLAHLTEWEQMFLGWYRVGFDGRKPDLPAPGYKWNQTPELNQEIWRRYRRKQIARVLRDFQASYEEILSLAKGLSSLELFAPGHFSWTGRNPLTTYLGANTVSHYRTATKIIKRWSRSQSQLTPHFSKRGPR